MNTSDIVTASHDPDVAAARPRVPLPSAVVRGSLEHGMLICLGLHAREPDRFEAAAVALVLDRWLKRGGTRV